jgi:hypothetical protein
MRGHRRDDFLAGGSESVYLCHRCLNRRILQMSWFLIIILTMVGGIAVTASIYFSDVVTGHLSIVALQGLICLGVQCLFLIPLLLVSLRRQSQGINRQYIGEQVAIKLRRKSMQALGYTHFVPKTRFDETATGSIQRESDESMC